MPETTFNTVVGHGPSVANLSVTTQIHVARDAPLSSDPAAAYESVIAAAHNLEAQLAGTALVGNNLGAALEGARSDAAYAQMLFLFLGLPGAVLAALLTAALAGAGADRRRAEQALLRTRQAPDRRTSPRCEVTATALRYRPRRSVSLELADRRPARCATRTTGSRGPETSSLAGRSGLATTTDTAFSSGLSGRRTPLSARRRRWACSPAYP